MGRDEVGQGTVGGVEYGGTERKDATVWNWMGVERVWMVWDGKGWGEKMGPGWDQDGMGGLNGMRWEGSDALEIGRADGMG